MGKGMRAGKRPRQKNAGMQQQLQQVQAMQAMTHPGTATP